LAESLDKAGQVIEETGRTCKLELLTSEFHYVHAEDYCKSIRQGCFH